MPDLFVTLVSISPSASRVDGRNAERLAGVSPSMKDGVLAERSVAPTSTPQPGVVDGNTLALWHFDEPSGTVAANSVPGSPSFVAPGPNPAIAAAKFINGRFFDGSSTWMDAVPTQTIRDQLRGDMTVEGWIYLDPAWASATATYQLGVLSLQTTSVGLHTTTQPQFVIELCRVAPPSDPGQTVQALSFWWLGDDGTLHKKTDVPVTVPTGVWTHFAWRRRLRGGDWELSYFQNGAHIVTSSGAGDVVSGSTNKFRLGAVADTGAPTDNFFKGGLDDIRVSNCARSDQEILQAYRRASG